MHIQHHLPTQIPCPWHISGAWSIPSKWLFGSLVECQRAYAIMNCLSSLSSSSSSSSVTSSPTHILSFTVCTLCSSQQSYNLRGTANYIMEARTYQCKSRCKRIHGLPNKTHRKVQLCYTPVYNMVTGMKCYL